jgi:putative membrane protein
MEKILKYSVIAILGLFVIALVIQLIAPFVYHGYYGYGPWMMGYGGMMGGFGMLGGAIFLIIFIVVVFALLEQKGIKTEKSDALEILKKRYAAGEITKEEYLEKKKDLE